MKPSIEFNPKFLNLPVDLTPKWVELSCIVVRLCHGPWHDNAEQLNHGPLHEVSACEIAFGK